jgi:hypothetical protein
MKIEEDNYMVDNDADRAGDPKKSHEAEAIPSKRDIVRRAVEATASAKTDRLPETAHLRSSYLIQTIADIEDAGTRVEEPDFWQGDNRCRTRQ